ncbi:MAG: SGNH/GDSL hydrolase family protein, partial [Candidatus Latescibacterota bacterium]
RRRPLVFYGTSITQGGCASRPGMAHVALLGRWLDRPVVNLGFSGNGTMDPEMADLLAELDAAAYVIDCLPNLSPEGVSERTGPLVERLRQGRPVTPIVLVEDRTLTNAALLPERQEHHRRMRAALATAVARLRDCGVEHLHVAPGAGLLGEDGEATVDGSHPTDLGFHRQATALLPLLRSLCDAEERACSSAAPPAPR